MVTEVIPGSPAASRHIAAGDEITSINDTPVTGTSIKFCKKLIEESVGQVKVTVCKILPTVRALAWQITDVLEELDDYSFVYILIFTLEDYEEKYS
eukprot:sb/3479139/